MKRVKHLSVKFISLLWLTALLLSQTTSAFAVGNAEVNACSGTAGTGKTVQFQNQSSSSVKLYRVNSNCSETLIATLSAGSNRNQSTYVNYVWRMRNSTTSVMLLEATITSNTSYVTLTDPATATPTNTATATATATATHTPTPICTGSVTAIRLWNLSTSQPISIVNNGTLYFEDLPASFNLDVAYTGTIVSTSFSVNGQPTTVQTGAPFRSPNDLDPWTPSAGTYTVQTTVYSGVGGTGTVCDTDTITFTLANRATATPTKTNTPTTTPTKTSTSTATATNTNTPTPTAWACYATGGVRSEEWIGTIPNVLGLEDLTTSALFPNGYSQVTYPGNFDLPSNVLPDASGRRVRAWVVAPTTGTYTFYLASDDSSELYFSMSDVPAEKQLIASIIGWTGHLEWTKYTSQRSAQRYLVAGQRYYIEALMKESWGDDNLSVGWMLPGASTVTVIPGSQLTPYNPSCVLNTPTPTATSIATNTGTPTATPTKTNTPDPAVYCLSSGDATTITWNNQSTRPFRVYWVAYDCREYIMFMVNPGQSSSKSTYANTVWRVRDYESNTLLREITATAPSMVVNIVEAVTPTPSATPLPATPTRTPTSTRTPLPTHTPTASPTPLVITAPCIGNQGWLDSNLTGAQDSGEIYFRGVKAYLWADNNNDGTPESMVTSSSLDSKGNYRFCALQPGTHYYVQFVPLRGFSLTIKDAAGVADDKDSDADSGNGFTDVITLGASDINNNVDVGSFRSKACVGDRVWNDLNADGIYDSNETTFGGMNVKLWQETTNDNIADLYVGSMVTGGSGAYSFCNVLPGNRYMLQFIQPAGYTLSPQNAAGSTEVNDSDANPATGFTDVLTFTLREINTGVDVGVVGSVNAAEDVAAMQLLPDMQPSVIALSEAKPEGTVDLIWSSTNAEKVAGYQLFRSGVDGNRASAVAVSNGTIPASQGNISYTDTTATAGASYIYWIDVLYIDGTTESVELYSDPSTATLSRSIFLPIISR